MSSSNAVWAEYETDSQRLTLDISAQATSKFGFTFQDRVITPKGVATVIGVLETLGAPPKLYVLYEGEPFVTHLNASPEEMKKWTKLADSTNAAAASMADTREYHNLRQVTIFGQRKVIVMQSANGPCPVIALANVLLLRGQLPSIEKLCTRQDAVVTATQLQQAVLDFIVSPESSSHHPVPQFSETARKDGTLSLFVQSPAFEQLRNRLRNPNEGPRVMQRFYDGLFVEPIHDVIDGFASSEDAALFALAGVRLVHGWLMDFESEAGKDLSNLRTQSCSELQVAASLGDEEPSSGPASDFLRNSQTQLTELGLMVLSTELQDHEYMVMFRNNHFGVVVADKGKLYTLVTDVAFTQRNDVVLQEVRVKDDGEFVDGAASELEPVVRSALEKFEGRYNVEQIRKAVETLMQQPNDLFLMAIQEAIDGPSSNNKNQNQQQQQQQQPVVQGQLLNTDAAAAASSNASNSILQGQPTN